MAETAKQVIVRAMRERGLDDGCHADGDYVAAELDKAGFAIVPKEPTEEMVRAGAARLDHPSVFMGGPSKQNIRKAPQAYAAMIANA